MRQAKTLVTVFLSILLTFPSLAGQTSTKAPQSIQRDPQALNILGQVLDAAGGLQILSAIQDFTATGSISYNWGDSPVQGSVSIKGRGLSQFRIDTTLPDGVHSWVVTSSIATEKRPDGSSSPLPLPLKMKPATLTFPLTELIVAVQDVSWSISYLGLVTHNGQPAYAISLQKILPANSDPSGFQSSVTRADFFIDTKTFAVLSVQDRAYSKNGAAGDSTHEMEFSNYQQVNGVLVPFSITERIGGQQTVTIQLSQVNFSSGLTDSDFAL